MTNTLHAVPALDEDYLTDPYDSLDDPYDYVEAPIETSKAAIKKAAKKASRTGNPATKAAGKTPANVIKIPVVQAASSGIFGDVPDPSVCEETADTGLYPATHLGLTERTYRHFGHWIVWSEKQQCWYVYNGQGLWVQDKKGNRVAAMIRTVIRSITVHELEYVKKMDPNIARLEAQVATLKAMPDMPASASIAMEVEIEKAIEAVSREHRRWATSLETGQAAVKAVLDALKDQVTRDDSIWDQNLLDVNLLNGVYDIGKGWLREHSAEDYMTMQVPVNYMPDATSWALDKVLAHIDSVHPGYSVAAMRWLGYCMTGIADGKVFVNVYGPPDSGKSTLWSSLYLALGGTDNPAASYAATLAPSDLGIDAETSSAPNIALNEAMSKRFWYVGEAEHAILSSDLVKRITGGDPVRSRTMYETGGPAIACGKINLIGNGESGFSASDEGMMERFWPMPFPDSLPRNERDPQVKRTLEKTQAGQEALIAAVLHAGTEWYLDYKTDDDCRRALNIPDEIDTLREAVRDANNPISEWLEENFILAKPTPGETTHQAAARIEAFEESHGNVGRATTSDLLKHCNKWYANRGGKKQEPKKFAKLLTSLGYPAIENPTSFKEVVTGGQTMKFNGKFRQGLRFAEESEWLRYAYI